MTLRLLIPCLLLLLHAHSTQAQIAQQMLPISKSITGTPAPGYLFITPVAQATSANYPSALTVLDSAGNAVYFEPHAVQTTPAFTVQRISDFKVQPSGLMSYSGRFPFGGGRGMYLMDDSFSVVDSVQAGNGFDTDGHDLIHTADGYFHLAGIETRIMDLSAFTTSNGDPGDVDAEVEGNVIQRLDAQKNVVFEWKSLDHFQLQDSYTDYWNLAWRYDHSHYNSIELDTDGNYLVSFRNMNEVTKINATTGAIMWRLGGKHSDFTFVGDTVPFNGQHDARRLPNGHLTMFDNGRYSSNPLARAIEYELDEVNMTATAVWQFAEPNGLFSNFMGSAQRLSNGNTLIDWAGAYPLATNWSIAEVDAAGNLVMELDFEDQTFLTYRALKYELPFELNRPAIACDQSTMTISAPDGYDYYEWSTGATTQSITVSTVGSYHVWVNRGNGYMSSEAFEITDLTNICGVNGVADGTHSQLSVFPIPANDRLTIQTSTRVVDYKVLSLPGIEVVRGTGNTVDVSALAPGVYLLQMQLATGQQSTQKVLIAR